MQTITVIIPAKNEELNIERCMASLKWCNKVQVLWMGSDKTGDIARNMGAEVICTGKSEKDDFIQVQRNVNRAIDSCKTDWILRIDADEVVTPELQEEIKKILSKESVHEAAFGIPRAQFFWKGFLKGGDWAYDRLTRLFKPKLGRYDPIVPVHEQFKVNGKIGYLSGKLLHYSHPSLAVARQKFQSYTDIEAQNLSEPVFQAYLKRFFLPPYVFLRWMIWHNGWRDGYLGIVAGAYRGWYDYLKYDKYLRLSGKKR